MSRSGLELLALRVPTMLLLAIVLLVGSIVLARRHLTRTRIGGGLAIAR